MKTTIAFLLALAACGPKPPKQHLGGICVWDSPGGGTSSTYGHCIVDGMVTPCLWVSDNGGIIACGKSFVHVPVPAEKP